MSKIKTALRFIGTPGKMITHIGDNGLLNWIPDKLYLKMAFYGEKKTKLNLENPTTFNEKLQWLKIYDRNPYYSQLVDKLAVKKIVSQKIGKEHVIPTLAVWDNAAAIDLSILPDQFVLKCTHDSGSVIVCKNKNTINKEKMLKRIDGNMRKDPFWLGREWPYRNVKPRIIAEEMLTDVNDGDLKDYKFFCFNGVVKCFKIDFDRFTGHRANYFTPDGELLRFGEAVCPPDYDRVIPLPQNLNQMIKFAEILSTGIPFVRVDFYESLNKVYFGEITFFPASGFGTFIPEEWDVILGNWLFLPSIK